MKYIVYFSEVEVTKSFSSCSLKRQATATNEANSYSDAHIPPSISVVDPASAALTRIAQQHEPDLEVDTTLSANVLHCHGIERKVVHGILEDWRCMPKFGGHIMWNNDVDERQRTPLDYWMMSFLSKMLPGISIWTSDHLPQGCVNAKEVLAVFGALCSLTRTSKGRRDLWSTEDGLFPAPHFGKRYGLTRDRYDTYHFAQCMRLLMTSGHLFSA